ncbi:MAG: hypothetical protein ACPG7F_00760 [Aggregatilineales bacterium]
MREEINYWHHEDADTGKKTSIELILDGSEHPKAEIRVDGEVVGTLDYNLVYGLRKQTGRMCNRVEVHYMEAHPKGIQQRFDALMSAEGSSRDLIFRDLQTVLKEMSNVRTEDGMTTSEDIQARFKFLMSIAHQHVPLRNAIAKIYRDYFLDSHTYVHHINRRWHEGDDDAE